jgi:hypothetical protein
LELSTRPKIAQASALLAKEEPLLVPPSIVSPDNRLYPPGGEWSSPHLIGRGLKGLSDLSGALLRCVVNLEARLEE